MKDPCLPWLAPVISSDKAQRALSFFFFLQFTSTRITSHVSLTLNTSPRSSQANAFGNKKRKRLPESHRCCQVVSNAVPASIPAPAIGLATFMPVASAEDEWDEGKAALPQPQGCVLVAEHPEGQFGEGARL